MYWLGRDCSEAGNFQHATTHIKTARLIGKAPSSVIVGEAPESRPVSPDREDRDLHHSSPSHFKTE